MAEIIPMSTIKKVAKPKLEVSPRATFDELAEIQRERTGQSAVIEKHTERDSGLEFD